MATCLGGGDTGAGDKGPRRWVRRRRPDDPTSEEWVVGRICNYDGRPTPRQCQACAAYRGRPSWDRRIPDQPMYITGVINLEEDRWFALREEEYRAMEDLRRFADDAEWEDDLERKNYLFDEIKLIEMRAAGVGRRSLAAYGDLTWTDVKSYRDREYQKRREDWREAHREAQSRYVKSEAGRARRRAYMRRYRAKEGSRD